MKKYHLMHIYQTSKDVGYLTSGKYCPITVFSSIDNEYKLEASVTIINTKKIILVKRISPYLVREVKTGIIFPIVNFKTKNKTDEYISCIYEEVHTFVCSEDGVLLSAEITTSEDLEDYNARYPDVTKLEEELLKIIEEGKDNVNNRKQRENIERTLEKNERKIERDSKRQERLKVRKLQRQFKQGRKNK